MTISPALFPAVTVTVVRDKKIRTALRTNQIAGFVTVPSRKKINYTTESWLNRTVELREKLMIYMQSMGVTETFESN